MKDEKKQKNDGSKAEPVDACSCGSFGNCGDCKRNSGYYWVKVFLSNMCVVMDCSINFDDGEQGYLNYD